LAEDGLGEWLADAQTEGLVVHAAGDGHVLDGDAKGLEDGDVVGRAAAPVRIWPICPASITARRSPEASSHRRTTKRTPPEAIV
jgi:hypothetical protein